MVDGEIFPSELPSVSYSFDLLLDGEDGPVVRYQPGQDRLRLAATLGIGILAVEHGLHELLIGVRRGDVGLGRMLMG